MCAFLNTHLQVAMNGISKGLEICGYIDSQIPTIVHGDAARLRQILVSLLANGHCL